MKTSKLLLIFSVFGILIIAGAIADKHINKQTVKKSVESEVIRKALDLYNHKIKLPPGTLIAIPDSDSLRVHVFNYSDPVEGLTYIGEFERKK